MYIERTALLLSAQGALLGNVGPAVLIICVDTDGNSITFNAVVDPGASEDELEDLRVATTEMVANFPDNPLDERIIEGTFPLRYPGGECVYLRRGYSFTHGPPPGGSTVDA
jgi:hypothetical protein